MKHKLTQIIFLLVCFIVSIFNCYSQTSFGIIKELSGTVEIKQPGASDFVNANAGDRIEQNTIISTGFKSNAIIEVGSTTIAVRPLTRLTLTEIETLQNSETITANLQAGRVRLDVKPPAGTRANARVQSPSATASVRGTGFEFDTINLFVNNGSVAFQGNRGKLVLVSANTNSRIDSKGKSADPIEISAESLTPSAPVGSDNTGTTGLAPVMGTFTYTIKYN